MDFAWQGHGFPVRASVGVVSAGAAAGGSAALIEGAEAACRLAKEEGRNRVKALEVGDAELQRRQELARYIGYLNRAIGEDRPMLRAQRIEPLVPEVTVRPHYEVLLGLRDEEGRPIPPMGLVEAAAYYKQTTELDRWVVRQTLRWMAGNRKLLAALGGISINLSGHSLSDKAMLGYVMEQLTETKVPPGKIWFEVTETAAVASLSHAERFIRTLREYGCRFSLDDFGSAHCSYSYLKTLPADLVKIDGMFVKDMMANPGDYAMVRSINEIAHVMGKRTVAEFVSSAEVWQALRELQVDYAQGFWVEEPLYLEELQEHLGSPLEPVAWRQPAPPAPPGEATDTLRL
jgi:EAL domain-containing protein (putative c-di-GMP-specific phosphodiesterase class I)